MLPRCVQEHTRYWLRHQVVACIYVRDDFIVSLFYGQHEKFSHGPPNMTRMLARPPLYLSLQTYPYVAVSGSGSLGPCLVMSGLTAPAVGGVGGVREAAGHCLTATHTNTLERSPALSVCTRYDMSVCTADSSHRYLKIMLVCFLASQGLTICRSFLRMALHQVGQTIERLCNWSPSLRTEHAQMVRRISNQVGATVKSLRFWMSRHRIA
jgi:hypothetical protein